MRLFQTIYDALHGGADGPPPLKPRSPDAPPPVPVRTRMGTPADVAMILDARVERIGRGHDWRESLGDLLTLVGLEDTLAQRVELSEELNVDVSDLDTQDADTALHAALVQRMAENDALAPQGLLQVAG